MEMRRKGEREVEMRRKGEREVGMRRKGEREGESGMLQLFVEVIGQRSGESKGGEARACDEGASAGGVAT